MLLNIQGCTGAPASPHAPPPSCIHKTKNNDEQNVNSAEVEKPCFTHIRSFGSLNSPMRSLLLLPPLYKLGNWSTKKVSTCFRSYSYKVADPGIKFRQFTLEFIFLISIPQSAVLPVVGDRLETRIWKRCHLTRVRTILSWNERAKNFLESIKLYIFYNNEKYSKWNSIDEIKQVPWVKNGIQRQNDVHNLLIFHWLAL